MANISLNRRPEVVGWSWTGFAKGVGKVVGAPVLAVGHTVAEVGRGVATGDLGRVIVAPVKGVAHGVAEVGRGTANIATGGEVYAQQQRDRAANPLINPKLTIPTNVDPAILTPEQKIAQALNTPLEYIRGVFSLDDAINAAKANPHRDEVWKVLNTVIVPKWAALEAPLSQYNQGHANSVRERVHSVITYYNQLWNDTVKSGVLEALQKAGTTDPQNISKTAIAVDAFMAEMVKQEWKGFGEADYQVGTAIASQVMQELDTRYTNLTGISMYEDPNASVKTKFPAWLALVGIGGVGIFLATR